MADKQKRTDRLLKSIFGGAEVIDRSAANGQILGSVGNASVSDVFNNLLSDQKDVEAGDDQLFYEELPTSRTARYAYYERLAKDPIIQNALKIHVNHALAGNTTEVKAISIEADGDAPGGDAIVKDLVYTFETKINQIAFAIGTMMAQNGVCYLRPHLTPGMGVVNMRCDYYTLPHLIREFEVSGRLVGYLHDSQYNGASKKMTLLEPWTFVAFKMPKSHVEAVEPFRVGGKDFDITLDSDEEDPVESQDYGDSMLAYAWGPYWDLKESILSLNMARRNAGKKERFIGVTMGRDSIKQATAYIQNLTKLLNRKKQASAKRALSKGYITAVENVVYPIAADGGGNVSIDQMDNAVDIAHIEDINFHVSRLASALSTDKSQLGFTDDMAGGLGEGGYLRTSIQAAEVAQRIRVGIAAGLNQLFKIHVASKFGKIFPEGSEPWKLTFNAISTALQREAEEARERAMTTATQLVAVFQQIDPDLAAFDKSALILWIATSMLSYPEDDIKALLSGKSPGDPSSDQGDNQAFDSLASLIRDEISAFKRYNQPSGVTQ